MAQTNIRVEWNSEGWAALALDVDHGVEKAAGKVRDEAKRIISSEGRVDTGAMLNSISSRRVRSDRRGAVHEVGSDLPYAIYQHNGVKGPVRPRRAKVLRFKSGGQFVFARETKGFKGIFYLTRAVERLTPEDFRW